jgi:hypothetical protein
MTLTKLRTSQKTKTRKNLPRPAPLMLKILRGIPYTVRFLCKMAVIAGERAKNIKAGSLKKCKIFTEQHAVRKMFFRSKFFALIKNCCTKIQTTRQQSPILKFEWAAIIFQLLQTWIFNRCETPVFRKIYCIAQKFGIPN